jgi:hypothetical protein
MVEKSNCLESIVDLPEIFYRDLKKEVDVMNSSGSVQKPKQPFSLKSALKSFFGGAKANSEYLTAAENLAIKAISDNNFDTAKMCASYLKMHNSEHATELSNSIGTKKAYVDAIYHIVYGRPFDAANIYHFLVESCKNGLSSEQKKVVGETYLCDMFNKTLEASLDLVSKNPKLSFDYFKAFVAMNDEGVIDTSKQSFDGLAKTVLSEGVKHAAKSTDLSADEVCYLQFYELLSDKFDVSESTMKDGVRLGSYIALKAHAMNGNNDAAKEEYEFCRSELKSNTPFGAPSFYSMDNLRELKSKASSTKFVGNASVDDKKEPVVDRMSEQNNF